MPEIKHQFTGGKMNKDLDERLVPNGEYRDAWNIQVSTSEGSDIGTVQNILGNDLVAGQDFIDDNSVCVGSIADEKNDKLYYFITNLPFLTEDFSAFGFSQFGIGAPGSWAGSAGGWGVSGDPNTGIYNAAYFGNDYVWIGVNLQQPVSPYTTNKILQGDFYEVTFTNETVSGGPLEVYLGGTIVKIRTSGRQQIIIKAGTTDFDLRFYAGKDSISSYVQGSRWNGRIDDISIREASGDIIIEYDSNGNSITPVFIDDSASGVLKLSPDNIITGINIIDDLLFWTDNRSEPKKINIKRSIEGTDSSGTVSTKLINKFQDIDISSNIDIEEEHISVIKKPPKSTLGLVFTNPDELADKTYSGIIETIADPGSNPNTSSFIFNVTKQEIPFDFSNIAKDDVIQIEIPLDTNSLSDFILDWKVGDTVAFKEFSSTGEVPTLPLKTWIAKGIIEEWSGNNFQDASTSLLRNGGFDLNMNDWGKTSDVVGNPWGGGAAGTQSFGWRWEGAIQAMVFQTGPWGEMSAINPWAKLWQSPVNHDFQVGRTYTLRYDLLDVPAGGLYGGNAKPLIGGVSARIAINGNIYNFGFENTVGTHIKTIEIGGTSANSVQISGTSTWLHNHLYFQTNNQQCRGVIDNVELHWTGAPNAQAQIKIRSIDINPPTPANTGTSTLNYVVDKYREVGHFFKDKLARFSYRYKYIDGEYSVFAPFSNVAFSPGTFDYHPKKGHNLGMNNQLVELELNGFVTSDLPKDVESIDILAKIEDSPNIYIVDTIKPNDPVPLSEPSNPWYLNKYKIVNDTIKGIVPSNQLLRPWDNVPKRALAQEVIGNRLIYGNYTQGYNLLNSFGANYRPEFNITVDSTEDTLHNKKSIKSLRDYQLGVVFSDEYGRETPVISNQSGSFYIDKDRADKNNILNISFLETGHPVDMKYFKLFIKETSNEYYNTAMDRYYVDEDNNIWLSFPSSDRNKIDLETILILKKGLESNDLVEEKADYKVLAIEDEAPDFIKTSKLLIEEKTHVEGVTGKDLFGAALVDVPLEGYDNFKMKYIPFQSSSGDRLHEIDDGDLYVEFSIEGNNKLSKRYKINKISCDVDVDGITDPHYSVKLETVLGEDVNFITDDISGISSTKILDYTQVSIYKYILDKEARYEGRFFVKIFGDEIFSEKIQQPGLTPDTEYRVVGSKKLYFMNDDHVSRTPDGLGGHDSSVTKMYSGAYNTTRTANWNTVSGVYNTTGSAGIPFDPNIDYPDTDLDYDPYPYSFNNFSKFAVFFRNYRYKNGEFKIRNSAGTLVNAGRYKFGIEGDDDWTDEFKSYTNSGSQNFADSWNSVVSPSLPYPAPTPTKVADKRQIDDEVWFIDNGPFVSKRHHHDNLYWRWIKPSTTNSRSGITPGSGYWNMDIGMGGITNYPGKSQVTIVPDYPNFFGIMTVGGNSNYNDLASLTLANKMDPGIQFRFKEDPSETIYRISPTTIRNRLIRYASNHRYGHSDGTNSGGGYALNEHEIPSLSPNFTNNWKLRIEPEITWNPATGTLGPIANGLEIDVAARSSGTTAFNTTSDIEDYYIVLDSNIGIETNTLKSLPITPGLIITEYNNSGSSLPGQYLIVKDVVESGSLFHVYLCGYEKLLQTADMITPTNGQLIKFQQPTMNGYSENSTNRINTEDPGNDGFSIDKPGLKAVGYNIEFVEAIVEETPMPDNPAIFETEPKESTNLDIYYEASGLNAITLNETTISTVLPLGSRITPDLSADGIYTAAGMVSSFIPDDTYIVEYINGNTVKLSKEIPISAQTSPIGAMPVVWNPGILLDEPVQVIRPNGSILYISPSQSTYNSTLLTDEITFNTDVWRGKTYLNWHNCYSFGNGVESNRVLDAFNKQYISNGVKVSTTLDVEYKEENRKYGLIYSGIYNSNSGINDLNQFVAAEKITKDINPIYGSIQKLHSRDADLVTLCEDKCLRILANKDVIYNSDGNPQLTANENVLGQTIPFGGEFGISKDPESFASESYRVYFTDKVRGAVMRLSKDGLTPISMHGMRDWFKDNLKLSNKIIGSYDDKKEEYNVTLTIPPGYTNNPSATVSFKEDTKGWVSFKSFIPEQGISMASDYYTMLQGRLYKHHNESVDRNTFYDTYYNSSINVMLNDGPGSIKSFHTLCYEGSQSDIEVPSVNDGEYYNLEEKFGWFVSGIETDKEVGSLNEFIEKEGKWFNYIKGVNSSVTAETDFGAFDIQGIGSTDIDGMVINSNTQTISNIVGFNYEINSSLQIGDTIHRDSVYTTSGGFQTIDPANFETNFPGTIEYIGTWEDFIPAYDENLWVLMPASPNDIWVYQGLATSGIDLYVSFNAPPGSYKNIIIGGPLIAGALSGSSSYYFFAKNHVVNTSSLVGYFADVKLENNSTEKAELFAVSSEITESSK